MKQAIENSQSNHSATMKLILTGLMLAMTTVATMAIAIPIPFTNGYIHLGDSMVFLSVLILGWKYGAFAAGVGSALADLFLGYASWAPWTLCIKGVMALLMGLVIEASLKNRKFVVLTSTLTVAAWGIFQLAIDRIIRAEAAGNAQALYSETVTNPEQLNAFLASMQTQLMTAVLIIPVFLVVLTVYFRKKEHFVIPIPQLIGITLAGLWMVFGYYVAGGIMYGNYAVSAFAIPTNMVQFLMGFVIAVLLSRAIEKTPAGSFFAYQAGGSRTGMGSSHQRELSQKISSC